MATAVFIKSESCDHYLFVTDDNLTKEEALDWVETKCGEEREYWCEILVENS